MLHDSWTTKTTFIKDYKIFYISETVFPNFNGNLWNSLSLQRKDYMGGFFTFSYLKHICSLPTLSLFGNVVVVFQVFYFFLSWYLLVIHSFNSYILYIIFAHVSSLYKILRSASSTNEIFSQRTQKKKHNQRLTLWLQLPAAWVMYSRVFLLGTTVYTEVEWSCTLHGDARLQTANNLTIYTIHNLINDCCEQLYTV